MLVANMLVTNITQGGRERKRAAERA
jgi:hypothetical protein